MIIDCHSHIWPNRECLGGAGALSGFAVGPEQRADMQEHAAASEPASVSLVLGFVCDHLEAGIPNRFVARYVTAHPERLLGLAGIDPTRKNVLEELKQLHEEGQFVGLTLSPACQNFHPCDTQVLRVYEAAQEYGWPVFFLDGETLPAAAVMSYAQPVHLDEIARMFPELRLVISHLGNPWAEQTMALLAKHRHFFATTAGLADKPWQAYRTLTLAYEYGVIGKLLFGSGFPRHTVKAAIEALYNLNKITLDSVLPAVPREQLRSIVERDSLALLGLRAPTGRTVTAATSGQT